MSFSLKKSRNEMVNFLYQADLLGSNDIYIENSEDKTLFNEIYSKIDEVDTVITDNLFNYQIERLAYVDRAIIRLATYEIMFSELDARIIINEAINLTKLISDLDDEKQHKFTNKLLDNINKNIRG